MAYTVLLLVLSNVFMTLAWYGHLTVKSAPLWAVILVSWLIAFFEYCLQVPANRYGYSVGISASQLKVLQEVITLVVFVGFAGVVLKEPLRWNVLAGFVLVGLGATLIYAPWQGPAERASVPAGEH